MTFKTTLSIQLHVALSESSYIFKPRHAKDSDNEIHLVGWAHGAN